MNSAFANQRLIQVCAVLMAATTSWFCAPARAESPILELLERPLARALMQTQSGEEAMRQVLRLAGKMRALGDSPNIVKDALRRGARELPDFDVFAQTLLRSRDAGVRIAAQDLAPVLQEADEALESYRALNYPGRLATGATAPLTLDETALIMQIARRRLKLNPGFLAENPAAGVGREIEFLRLNPKRTLQERFLKPAAASEGRALNEAENATGHAKLQNVLDQMNACTRAMPASVLRKSRARYVGRQLLVSQMLTAGGIITSSCEKNLSFKDFTTDMLTGAASTLLSASIGSNTSLPYRVRYMRVAMIGQARAATDAVVYLVSPWKNTHGKSEADAVLSRFAFNTAWSATSPVINTSVSTLLIGTECLLKQKAGDVEAANWQVLAAQHAGKIQFAQSLGSTFAYFQLRHHALDEDDFCKKK